MKVRFIRKEGKSTSILTEWSPFAWVLDRLIPLLQHPADEILLFIAVSAEEAESNWSGGYCELVLSKREWRRLMPLFGALDLSYRKGPLVTERDDWIYSAAKASKVFDLFEEFAGELEGCPWAFPSLLDLVLFHSSPGWELPNEEGRIHISIDPGWRGEVQISAGDSHQVPTGRDLFLLLLIAVFLEVWTNPRLDKHISLHQWVWAHSYLAFLLSRNAEIRREMRTEEWRTLLSKACQVLDSATGHLKQSKEKVARSTPVARGRQVIEGLEAALQALAKGEIEPARLAKAMESWQTDAEPLDLSFVTQEAPASTEAGELADCAPPSGDSP